MVSAVMFTCILKNALPALHLRQRQPRLPTLSEASIHSLGNSRLGIILEHCFLTDCILRLCRFGAPAPAAPKVFIVCGLNICRPFESCSLLRQL